MKRWLQKVTRFLFGPGRAKDTEARKLNEQLCQRVDDLKEKAAKGDSDASLKLGALKQGLTEQTLRLPPNKAKLLGFGAFVVLALVCGGGCNVNAEYVEADRLTYEAVAPRYVEYVKADPALSAEEKARIGRTVVSWKLRIDKNK